MKTSNKILLSGAIFVISLFLAFTLYSRKFIKKNDTQRYVKSGILENKVFLDSYESDTLYIRDIDCKLDPNSTQISVEVDKTFLSFMKLKNYRGIYPYHEYPKGNTYFSVPSTYTIGVKGKTNLVIISKKRSHVYSEEKLNIENLRIEANNDSSVSIDNDGQSLIFIGKNNASADIEGSFKTAEISCEYRSRIDAMTISFESLELNLSENSFARVKHAQNISGEMEDYAEFETVETCDVSGIEYFDHAKHKLESWD